MTVYKAILHLATLEGCLNEMSKSLTYNLKVVKWFENNLYLLIYMSEIWNYELSNLLNIIRFVVYDYVIDCDRVNCNISDYRYRWRNLCIQEKKERLLESKFIKKWCNHRPITRQQFDSNSFYYFDCEFPLEILKHYV